MSPTFPLRVAAVDVGSNAIRFLAAEFADPERASPLESHRAPVRMGHEAFRTGRLSGGCVEAGIEALAFFRRRMDALGVAPYRAVATSAVRESANGGEFVERAREEAGIRLEPIGEAEEARLVWSAVRRRVRMGGGEWLLVDLGGGSLEVSRIDAGGIRRTGSLPLGTVRLLEEACAAGAAEPIRRILEARAAALDLPGLVGGAGTAGVIATGGNAEVLAGLAGAAADARGVRTLPVRDLRRLLAELAPLSPRERMERFRLRPDRADVIVPAALVYERVAELAGAGRIVVPGVGVREGILHELADRAGAA